MIWRFERDQVGWDERLFGKLFRAVKRLRTPVDSGELRARRVLLADEKERLAMLAIAVAGKNVALREAEGLGGVSTSIIYLPRAIDFAPTRRDNEQAFVVRVALAATAIRHGLVPQAALAVELQPLCSLLVLRAAIVLVRDDFPSLDAELLHLNSLWVAAHSERLSPRERAQPRTAFFDALMQMGDGLLTELAARGTFLHLKEQALSLQSSLRPSDSEEHFHPLFGSVLLAPHTAGTVGATADEQNLPRGTEITMRPVDHVKLKQLGDEREESPLVHSFEKLHTLEEHTGGRKRADGSDEIAAHAEALEELKITEVIRSNERAESLMRSDAMFESQAGEVADLEAEEGIPYDEWNASRSTFRRAWCRVRAHALAERIPASTAHRLIAIRVAALKSEIDAAHNAFLVQRYAYRARLRQLDGPDIDDDSMVERHASLAAGVSPPDHLYVARRRQIPEVAIFLLLDASLSTDGWLDGRHIVEVEKDAALVLCEAVAGLTDELGVAAFYSQTRRDCRFEMIKNLEEPWPLARRRLASLQPTGYTRIGPPLRHATALLANARAKRRLILLVTDGKPNDYDRYEGSYGLDDVHHAVLEAQAHGIAVHGLAIDPSARSTLPRMFGLAGFTLLRSPAELAKGMADAVARMAR